MRAFNTMAETKTAFAGIRCRRFKMTALAQLVAATLVPAAAIAQSDKSDAPKSTTGDKAEAVESIVVTAQRRLQALQDVPIAISVVGGEELARRGVLDLQSLVGTVASLTISGAGGINGSNLVSLRGLSGQAIPIGASQTVAIYIDGEYIPRPDTAFFTLDDVERIEVLRGPQGALYGRNSTAGAINIITRTPGASLKAGGEVSVGSYNLVTGKGSLSGPLGGGFSAGISASYEQRSGYYTNAVTGNNMGPREAYTVRGKLRYESADSNFTAQLSLDTTHVAGQQSVWVNLYGGPSGPSFALPGAPTPVYIGVVKPWVAYQDAVSERRSEMLNGSNGAALTLTYRLGNDVELTSITAGRRWSVVNGYDLDATPSPVLFSSSKNENRTFMQELRAVVDMGGNHLTVGANYYDEDQSLGIPAAGGPNVVLPGTSPYDTSKVKAIGLFGQFEYALTKNLGITVGARWNQEKRDFANDYTAATNGLGVATPGRYLAGTLKDHAFIPSLGADYKLSRDAMVYGKVSRGYQAPGFGLTPGITATAPNPFAAEHLTAYELGVKSEFFDRRLSLNAAAFKYDYSDLQVRTLVGPGVINVQNAANATIRGLEINLAAKLGGGFSVGGNLTSLSAKYDRFCEPITGGSPLANDALCSTGVADRSGNYLINAPRWQGGLSVDYATALGDGELRAKLSYSGSAKVYYSAANEDIVSSGGTSKRIDVRIGYQMLGGPEIFAYGKNVTNDWTRDLVLRASPVFAVAHISEPRTLGAGLRYRF